MKHLLLKTWLILACLLMLGGGKVWAAVTPLSLPKTWNTGDGKSAYTAALGCTLSGLGSDYSSAPKLRFDDQGDYMIIQVADVPAAISFNIKGNSVSGTYSFKVQESADGSSYTDALDITSVSSSSASKSANLNSSTRYIKLIYATKASGNMGVGGIAITKATASQPYTVTFNAGTNGICSTSSLTESSVGAGVTLPSATGNTNYTFVGWSTSSTPTSADAGAAGATYKPSANTTLYAYYKVIPAAPTFGTAAGMVEKGTKITFSSTTEGCTYLYTTDGSDPDAKTGTQASSCTITSDCTVKVVAVKDGVVSAVSSAFYTVANHTATFYVNGAQSGAPASYGKGDNITFPADPSVDGVAFMGWTKTQNYSNATTAPSDMTKSATMGNGDVNYYAVFATQEGNGETTYTKLSSNSFETNAEYVLAAEESSDESTLHYFSSYTGTTANESWGVTSTNVTDAIIFTLFGTADALKAQNASGHYIQALATGKFRMSNSSTTLKLNSEGHIYNPADNSTYNLRYNHNNGSGGFRWYSGSTGTSAYFYKIEDGTTYSDYCTTVSTKATPTLSFAEATYEATVGGEFEAPQLTMTEGISVTYSSSETSVATVNATTGEVTLVAAGTTIITATFAGNDDYKPATASYELVVSAALVKHTAKFSVNGVIDDTQNCEVAEGANITFPTDPDTQYGLTFMGWTDTQIVGALADAPVMVNKETEVMGTDDVTYFAVFAKQSGNGSGYQLVESDLDNWTGDYLIVYNNTYAMNTHSGNQNANTFATYTNISEYYTEASKSISSNSTTDALVYRASATANGYSLYCVSDESYLGITANTTSTGAKLRWNTSYTESADDWTLGVGSVGNVGSNTLYIRWNNNSGSYRFAAYASTGQQAIQLFKKKEITYTDYCTSFITFDEANATIEDVFDTYGRVEVKRTLKANVWNTFCVPFDMTADQIAANFGEGAEVKELGGLDIKNETTYNMHFGTASAIAAGKPYMVRVHKDVASIEVSDAEGINVNTTGVCEDTQSDLTFHGNYTKMNAPMSSFIISDNNFYLVNSEVAVKGFRGYITIGSGSQVRVLNFNLDEQTTGLNNVTGLNDNDRIYNLQGQLQSKLQKGVNIVNGRKVIM